MSLAVPHAAPESARRQRLHLAWRRTETGCLFRLAGLDVSADLVAGKGGIYLVGVGTFLARCIEVGHDDDLGKALARVRCELAERVPDGLRNLSVTWAEPAPDQCDDVVRYLVMTLRPLRISREGANFRTAEPWPVNVPPEFRQIPLEPV